MRHTQSSRFLLIAFGLSAFASAQPWSGILDPTRAINWQRANVGVSGGIPTNYTQCGATIAAYTGSAAAINAAISACGANQYVLLGSGTFNLSSSIVIQGKSSILLRGSGPNSTKLVFSGAGVGGIFSATIFVTRNSPGYGVDSVNVQPGGPNACSWTAGYAKGATSITLANCGSTGIHVGDSIVLDQKNDLTDTNGWMACDLTVGGTACSATGQNTNNTGRYIGGVSWAQMQHVTVASIPSSCGSACTGAGPFAVTINQGLYANNWGHLGAGTTGAYSVQPVNHVGVENLAINATTCPDDASCQSGITFFDCDECWRKNVVTVDTRRNHTWFVNSRRGEVRDSYFFGVKNAASQSYGVELAACDDCLIENNIFQQVSSGFMMAGATGTVWAYNFTINHPVGTGYTYMQADYFSHSDGDYFDLYEGNQIGGLFADQLHGTSNAQTAFRNRITGRDWNILCQPGPTTCLNSNQTFAFDLDSYNRVYNIIGNVLGTAGYHTAYEAYPPNTYTRGQCNLTIYEVGFGGGVCDGDGAGGVSDDQHVRNTLMRWGNYDTVNAAVRWDATESSPGAVAYVNANSTPASRVLPASLYLSSKPSFFNVPSGVSAPFPPIGPDVKGGSGPGGFSYPIPAANCYSNILLGPSNGGGGVLPFDAANCYNGAAPPAPPTVLPAPTNLTAVVH
jgi:hypothetical protein